MKCTDKRWISFILIATLLVISISGCGLKKESETILEKYESANYNNAQFTGAFIAEELCVAENSVALDGFQDDTSIDSAGLYDLNGIHVLYSYKAHERVYPASITKIMTALLTLENGNLDDMVTISKTAAASSLPYYAQVCGLKAGDVWKLEDLLNALMIYSGNDVALAIAEHIGGSVDEFVNMMNRRARELYAVNTRFMNPHGLHHDKHYTTAYDLYLIFKECIKDERFVDIIDKESCTLSYTSSDGSTTEVTYKPTNLYASGDATKPDNVEVIGGKTGTNDDYSRCLILLSKDSKANPYISVIIGAPDKDILYKDMTALMESIPAK